MKHFRQYVRPETLEEAVSLRKSVGPKSLYIAGGTTVVPFGSKNVEVLIDISRLGPEGISRDDGTLTIGAATRLSELLRPEIGSQLPVLSQAAGMCATPLIRNMATVGGSLAGIYLPSDIAVALLALECGIEIVGDTERIVSIRDLLAQGWLQGHDIIRSITVRQLKGHEGASFQKFGRSDIDIAIVNAAAVIVRGEGRRIENLVLSVGQTFAMPTVLHRTAEEARGRDLSLELIEAVAQAASGAVEARSDFRASAGYRKHLVGVLVGRALTDAAEEAGFNLDA